MLKNESHLWTRLRRISGQVFLRATYGLTLFLTISSLSCATLGPQLPPRLEKRQLRLCKDSPSTSCYEYEVCEKRFLGICTKKHVELERGDLKDPVYWKQLIDAGFRLMVPQNPQ